MLIQTLPVEHLLQKYKQIRRRTQLLQVSAPLRDRRTGSRMMTKEVVNLLELLRLADNAFQPRFYQSEYNKYYEDAV